MKKNTFIACMLAIGCLAASAQQTICNPCNIPYRYTGLAGVREAADPSLIYFKGHYYLFASKCGDHHYLHSTDMAHWNRIATNLPMDGYAPTVEAMGDTLYFCHSQDTEHVFVTTDPLSGQWQLMPYSETAHCLGDPMILADGGKLYFYHGSSGNPKDSIRVQQVNPRTLQAEGPEVNLISMGKTQYGWEVVGDYNERPEANPWIEGVWVTKHNGTYYLQYSSPGTEYKSYSDAVYTSPSPTGPMTIQRHNPFCQHPEGFITGAGHGSTFCDKYGNYWHIVTGTISRRHVFERRLVMYPVFFDSDGEMWAYTRFGDYPIRLPNKKIRSPRELDTGWMLLNYAKPVQVSSTLSNDYAASQAVDENIRTWWSAATGQPGEYFVSDLTYPCQVHAVQINFADHGSTLTGEHDDVYRYVVEGSMDGKSWFMMCNRAQCRENAPHAYMELSKPMRARYVRITNVHTPSGQFSLSGFRVFGLCKDIRKPSKAQFTQIWRPVHDRRQVHLQWTPVKGATGYNIRYGIAHDKMYLNYTVMGQDKADLVIRSLNSEESYTFCIEAFNEAGTTLSAPCRLDD